MDRLFPLLFVFSSHDKLIECRCSILQDTSSYGQVDDRSVEDIIFAKDGKQWDGQRFPGAYHLNECGQICSSHVKRYRRTLQVGEVGVEPLRPGTPRRLCVRSHVHSWACAASAVMAIGAQRM